MAMNKIKEYFSNNVAPKYFNLDNIDDTNVGLFGTCRNYKRNI